MFQRAPYRCFGFKTTSTSPFAVISTRVTSLLRNHSPNRFLLTLKLPIIKNVRIRVTITKSASQNGFAAEHEVEVLTLGLSVRFCWNLFRLWLSYSRLPRTLFHSHHHDQEGFQEPIILRNRLEYTPIYVAGQTNAQGTTGGARSRSMKEWSVEDK